MKHRGSEPPRKRSILICAILIFACSITGAFIDPGNYTGLIGMLTLPAVLGFPLLYMTVPWKTTAQGRALMAKARALALLYLAGLIAKVWDYPFQGYLMALITTYLFVAITWQFIVLLQLKLASGLPSGEQKEIFDVERT